MRLYVAVLSDLKGSCPVTSGHVASSRWIVTHAMMAAEGMEQCVLLRQVTAQLNTIFNASLIYSLRSLCFGTFVCISALIPLLLREVRRG